MEEEKWTVLIIDDDEDFTESTRLTLEAHGYAVLSAHDAKSGFSKLAEGKPDLVILDMMMEGKGAGFIFSRKMRKDPQYARVPILMLTGMREATGFDFPGKAKDSVFLPVDEFVEKPVEPKLLLAKIVKLLNKRP